MHAIYARGNILLVFARCSVDCCSMDLIRLFMNAVVQERFKDSFSGQFLEGRPSEDSHKIQFQECSRTLIVNCKVTFSPCHCAMGQIVEPL